MIFILNDVIHFKGLEDRYERILWISSDNVVCTTIELNVTKIKIIDRKIAEIEQLLYDGIIELYENIQDYNLIDDNLSECSIKRRDKAYDVVKYIFELLKEPYLFDSNIRRKAILKASHKFNISDVVVYKYLRLFWQGGKIKNSLIPNYNNCGGKGIEKHYKMKTGRKSFVQMISGENGGVIVDKNTKVIFDTTIKRYFNNSKEIKLTKAYELMIKDFFTDITTGEVKVLDKSAIPTFRQFEYYYYKNRDLEDEIKNRKGKKRYSLNFRPLPSNSTNETFCPGHRYQLDATVADVYLVNRTKRSSVIGRPIVYLVVDVFSRLITGVYVGLEGPSWNGAASAIYNCCEDKVEFCKKYGIEITNDQWPSNGLPEIILGDRGEMVGPIGEKVIEGLNVTLENTPSYRGDAKGIVEQKFNAVNYNIKNWTPGAIKQEYRERGERDYRLDAKLDIEEFTKIIIHAVIEKNNNPIKNYPIFQEMLDDNVNPIPTEIWSWGMKHRTGILHRVPEDLLKIGLMRRGSASITKTGIIFKKVNYSTNSAEEYNWLLKARTLGTERIDIVYDNRDMSIIFIIKDNKLIPCTVRDENKMHKNRTFEELEDFNFMAVVNHEGLTNLKNQNEVNMNVEIENIVKEAEKKRKNDKIKKNNIKDIRENRKEENHEVRKDQSLSNIGKLSDEAKINKIKNDTTHLNEKHRYESNSRNLDFIRRMKKKDK